LEPLDVIQGSLACGKGVVLRARTGSKTIGLATAHLVQRPSLAFMVYLAVAGEMRRRRIGSSLFERLWRACVERSGHRGGAPVALVWEVDVPHLAEDKVERDRRLARIEFFRSRGGEIWLETYLQPPVRGVTPVAMLLMGRPAHGTPRPPIAEVVRGIYFEKYGEANGIDRAVLDRLAGLSLARGV
jgi:hypothetical protein